MEFKKYIAKEKETVMAFKFTNEIYLELVDTLSKGGVPFEFGYHDDDPYIRLPICGGGEEEAHIGDYIAPFGSCFRVYKQSAFVDMFELESEASQGREV